MRAVSGKLSRSQAFVLLRYTLIIATAYLLLVEHEFSSTPSGLILLIAVALTSNVVVAQLPARITDSTTFNAGVILGDTLWITGALLYSGMFGAEFFYLYFFVLLLAAIGENLGLIAVGTIAVCTAYIFVLSATGGSAAFWSSGLLIRIPFLLTAAAFYGYLVDRVRRERQRAREESDANEQLEREIFERKQAEHALKAAKDYAENLIDSSLDMIISTDVNWNIVEFNQAAEEAFGYSKAEVVGNPLDILYADPSEGLRVQTGLRNDGRFSAEIRNKRKSGEAFYSYISASVIRDADGTVVGGVGVSRDITERKRAEEALRESEERYRKLVELSPDAIIVHSEGKITYVNTAAATLLGAANSEQLIGTPVMAIVHPDYREIVVDRIQERIDEGTVLPLTEEKIARLDGTGVDVEVTAAPITFHQKLRVQAVIRDITERKRAEAELQARARELASKTERLEALATLSRTVSATLDPPQVLDFVVAATVRLLDANVARLWSWDEAAEVLRLAAKAGDPDLTPYPIQVFRRGESLVGRVFQQRDCLVIDSPTMDPRYEGRDWARENGIQVVAAVPLLIGERAVGALAAARRNTGSFQAEELALLNSFAAQAAIALENARLYSEALEKTERLEGLIRTSAKVTGTLQAEEVLGSIAEEAARLLGVEGAGFRLLKGDRLVVGGRYGLAHQVMLNLSIRVWESLSGLVAQEARPISIPNLEEDQHYLLEHKAAAAARGVTSYLGVPLRYRDRIVGVLNVFGKEQRGFHQREVDLLQAFAAQAAIAIENARHMHEAESRARGLRTLTDVTRLMTSSLEHRQVAASIVKAAAELLGADLVRLWVGDETTQELHLQVSHGGEDLTATPYLRIGKGQGVIGAIWETGEPAFVPDLREEPRWLNTPLLERTGLRSFAGLPLTIEDQVIGVLSLFTREVRSFTPEEGELMALFAAEAAISLDKARLYWEVAEQKEHLEETVAERKRAEAALQAAKDYAENLIDSSLDMIISADMQRKIVEFNRAAEETFGYSKAEVLGKPVDLLYADPSEGARVFTTILKDGMFTEEVTNKRKTGETFCCYLSASVIRDASGRVAGGMGISRDITEQKRADEELRATQLQLIQAAKFESVGQLAAGVAHEVKNPLAIILQGLNYLSQAFLTTEDDKVALVLDKMGNAVRRADRVVKGLLDFSVPRGVDVTTDQINTVVEQSLLLVKHELLRTHVVVVKELAGNLPSLKLDRNKIEQVFVNLFMNAIQAMPEGGMLTVKTYPQQPTELGPEVGRWKTDQAGTGETLVMVTIEDTGTGIPDDKLDRVFDPFFTTKPPGQGTGLGLSVTRKIIELHSGMIDIRNRLEGGVRVTITFKAKGDHGDAEESRS